MIYSIMLFFAKKLSILLSFQFLSLSKSFPGKISSEMECFRAPRNQRFSSPPTMVGLGISSDNLCIPEPGHYHTPFKCKSRNDP